MRARRSSEQWSAVLDELSESSESVESFCRRAGALRDTLVRYRRAVRDAAASAAADSAPDDDLPF